MADKTKVWLDTDIGSDIDDAVALAYLLANPDCELVGISTVSGEAVKRAQIADAIVTAAGRSVPIFVGAEAPLLSKVNQPAAQQATQLTNWPHAATFPQLHAVEAMYAAIKANPGRLTLLAVGPMTNVALLTRMHPDAASLLKSTVLMCGEFFRRLPAWGEAEWNALCDPYAAAMVYDGLKLRSVGLDVTMQVRMHQDEVAKRFSTGVLRVVYDFAKPWFERIDHITFHDPLAAVSIFTPGVMTCRRGRVSVELASERARGRTYFDEDPAGPHEVGAAVEADAFFQEYFRYQ